MDNNIEGLLIRKSEVQKQVRSLNQQNNASKRQIQQAFEELRAKVNSQEREILSKCDQNVNDSVNEMEGMLNSITSRIEEIKAYAATIKEAEKKNEVLIY